MSDIFISVVIVNYNSGLCLQNCIDSLPENSENIEIIVVDNASTDQSLTLVEKNFQHLPRLQLIRNTKNLGFAAGNNIGIAKSVGHYILLLNPDCIVGENALMQMQKIISTYPEAGRAGCLERNENGSIQASCARRIPNPWEAMVRVLHLDKVFTKSTQFQNYNLADKQIPTKPIFVEGISGAFMFIKRAALIDVGPLDESYFLYCEDDDWYMRFREKGWKILFVPNVEILHYKGVSGRGKPVKILWYKHRSMLRFYRKFYLNKYPKVLYPVIWLAVWCRFGLLSILSSK